MFLFYFPFSIQQNNHDDLIETGIHEMHEAPQKYITSVLCKTKHQQESINQTQIAMWLNYTIKVSPLQ